MTELFSFLSIYRYCSVKNHNLLTLSNYTLVMKCLCLWKWCWYGDINMSMDCTEWMVSLLYIIKEGEYSTSKRATNVIIDFPQFFSLIRYKPIFFKMCLFLIKKMISSNEHLRQYSMGFPDPNYVRHTLYNDGTRYITIYDKTRGWKWGRT